jgi:chromosome segregation ATPase
VTQLERQHEAALSIVYEKLQSQEENCSRVSESLTRQITALREEAELASSAHCKEVRRLKEEYEAQLQEVLKAKETTESSLRVRLCEVQATLEAEHGKARDYKSQLSHQKQSSGEEIGKLQTQMKALQAENERVKRMHHDGLKRDHELIERERQQAKAERTAYMEDTKKHLEQQMNELRAKLEGKDSLHLAVEQELTETRRQLEASSQDLQALKDALRTTQKVLDIQEQDLQILRTDREEFRKEGRLLGKEADVLEHDLGLVKRENAELKKQSKRMQKIVYGRPRKSFRVS